MTRFALGLKCGGLTDSGLEDGDDPAGDSACVSLASKDESPSIPNPIPLWVKYWRRLIVGFMGLCSEVGGASYLRERGRGKGGAGIGR